jgi:hypothetical protein
MDECHIPIKHIRLLQSCPSLASWHCFALIDGYVYQDRE